ncbi:hypothetical protein EV383_0239 [Pseudonocardia sediminis]|uniref:Uncharacterized protein n=1 Tax=Pseudonocardia sediminis TaxID=1397368 RepID=A0A4Q7UR35_PSEST|nr:hypothetical protein [Pseudonocardia sediminis]RZT83434.1 hypothetical protein EV383_0239 [Pseudonocardia sediminis]
MDTSTILFLSALACGVLFAVCAVYSQMRDGVRLGSVRWTTPAVILGCCAAFGGLAYLLDSGVAEQTLYEIEAEGTGAQVPRPISFAIPVEHPGAMHSLMVAPKTDTDVTDAADVRVQLNDPAGRVLVDEPRTLDQRCPSDGRCEWDSYTKDFTPPGPGTYELVVTVLTPDVPIVHVWVGDELKTDGQRAPGY